MTDPAELSSDPVVPRSTRRALNTASAVCKTHAVVMRDVEDGRDWRREHDREDRKFREWIRNEFGLIRQCIDGKMDSQTAARRADISKLHDKVDGLKTLMLVAATSALFGLIGTVVTLVIVLVNKG